LSGTTTDDCKPLLATHGTRRHARYVTPSAVYNAIRNSAFSDLVRSILNNKETQTLGDLECSISAIRRHSELECSISAIRRHKHSVTLSAA
jgi:hypothetical protein